MLPGGRVCNFSSSQSFAISEARASDSAKNHGSSLGIQSDLASQGLRIIPKCLLLTVPTVSACPFGRAFAIELDAFLATDELTDAFESIVQKSVDHL